MEQTQVINELSELVKEGKEKILPTKWYPEEVIGANYMVDGDLYAGWHTKALSFLKLVLPEESDFIAKFAGYDKNYYGRACASIKVLESAIEYIEKGFLSLKSFSAAA